MTYDRAAILTKAWEIYRTVRYECERRALRKGFRANRERWVNALRAAWGMAKATDRAAAMTAAERAAELCATAERRLIEALTSEPNLHFQSTTTAIDRAYADLDRLAA